MTRPSAGAIKRRMDAKVAALVKSLLDPKASFTTRFDASNKLQKSAKAAEAIPTLITALSNKSADVQKAAASSLGDIFGKQGKAIAAHGKPALDALVELATTRGDGDARQETGKALGYLGPIALDAVLELATSKDVDAARAGLLAIYYGATTNPTAVDRVMKALATAATSKDADVRRDAAFAAGAWKERAAPLASVLATLCADKSETVQDYAVDALRDIGPDAAAAVPALVKLLKLKNMAQRTANALEAIGVGDPDVVVALKKLTKSDDYSTAQAAESALSTLATAAAATGKVDDAAIDSLLADSHSWGRANEKALNTLTKLGERAMPRILAAMKSDERAKALYVLGHMGKLALPHLALFTDALADTSAEDHDYLRALAIGGLTALGDVAVPALIDALAKPATARAAAGALAALGSAADPAVPALVKAASSKDAATRVAARQSLAVLAPAKLPDTKLDKQQVARITAAMTKARADRQTIPLCPLAYLDVTPPAGLVDLWTYAAAHGAGAVPCNLELRDEAEAPEVAWFGNRKRGAPQVRSFAGDGRGGFYALWLVAGRKPNDVPIIFLGDEGETAVIADSMTDFLAILATGQNDLGQLIAGGLKATDAKAFGKSEAATLKTYRAWLDKSLQLKAPAKLADLVGAKGVPALPFD